MFNILINSLIYDSYEDFIHKLYDNSSHINDVNVLGETLLHFAVFYGMIDKYYALLNFGIDIKLTNNKNSLLHYACYSNKDDFIITELLKLNIDILQKNNKGESCIHLSSNQRICYYLNLYCINNNIDLLNMEDNNKNTVLHTSFGYKFYDSSKFWIINYPKLEEKLNSDNLKYNQINLKPNNFTQEI